MILPGCHGLLAGEKASILFRQEKALQSHNMCCVCARALLFGRHFGFVDPRALMHLTKRFPTNQNTPAPLIWNLMPSLPFHRPPFRPVKRAAAPLCPVCSHPSRWRVVRTGPTVKPAHLRREEEFDEDVRDTELPNAGRLWLSL